MKWLFRILLANLVLTGYLINLQAQQLSYFQGEYFLDEEKTQLDALQHRLNLDTRMQIDFERLKKWERIRKTSGNLFLLSAGVAGLALGATHLIWNHTNILVAPVFALPFAVLALFHATTAAISFVTWSTASIRAPNLRTEFLYHYNSALSTTSDGPQLEFGFNSGGIGLSLSF